MNLILCSGSVFLNHESSSVPVLAERFSHSTNVRQSVTSSPAGVMDNDSLAVTHSPSYSLVSALEQFVNVSNYPVWIIMSL